MNGLGIFIVATKDDAEVSAAIAHMDTVTREWEMRAARGECAWVCADCCITFPDGMPSECTHGHQGCTEIIQRDKADARTPKEPA
jgi:hypothetical protein